MTIYDIIKKENQSLATSSNENGVFMMFHDLSNPTYHEIEKFLDKRKKNRTVSQSDTSEKLEYKPYTQEEFPAQENLAPKLKYSNKEKNLIKRQWYNENMSTEESQVVYCDFQVENTTDSEIDHVSEKDKRNLKNWFH